MGWQAGTITEILQRTQWDTGRGRVGPEAEKAIIEAVRQNQGAFEFSNPVFSTVTNADETAQVLRSSPGRLFLIVVEQTNETEEVSIVLTSGGDTIIVGGVICPAQIAASGSIAAIPGVAKVAWFASPPAAGERIPTDLRVRAFLASDGTTGAADGVVVTALTSA